MPRMVDVLFLGDVPFPREGYHVCAVSLRCANKRGTWKLLLPKKICSLYTYMSLGLLKREILVDERDFLTMLRDD
jgi:hypothetical protein